MPTINLKNRNLCTKNHRTRSTLESDKVVQRMRVYNTSEWRKLRSLHLSEYPLCQVCLCREKKKYTHATECHHLKSFMLVNGASRQQLALDYNNICSICQHCHSKYHSIIENRGENPDNSIEEIAKILDNYESRIYNM